MIAVPCFDIWGAAHRKHEYEDYRCLREQGQAAYNFVHFHTPVIVVMDGEEIITENNACILYTPGNRQEYRPYGNLLLNDYLTFTTSDKAFMSRHGLPENRVFYLQSGAEITRRLEWISWAAIDKTEPHGDDITEAIMELFSVLSDLWIDKNPASKRLFETKQRFTALRSDMRKDPSHWTVDEMARRVWLTRSRFSVLYNEFFGISPNADLINMRIEQAKNLLETTNRSVAEISHICGYCSVEYFIRVFNRRMGKTPLQYRKIAKKP